MSNKTNNDRIKDLESEGQVLKEIQTRMFNIFAAIQRANMELVKTAMSQRTDLIMLAKAISLAVVFSDQKAKTLFVDRVAKMESIDERLEVIMVAVEKFAKPSP